MAVGLGIAILVRSQTIPRYEAESQIVLDVRNTTFLKFDAVVSGLLPQPEVDPYGNGRHGLAGDGRTRA